MNIEQKPTRKKCVLQISLLTDSAIIAFLSLFKLRPIMILLNINIVLLLETLLLPKNQSFPCSYGPTNSCKWKYNSKNQAYISYYIIINLINPSKKPLNKGHFSVESMFSSPRITSRHSQFTQKLTSCIIRAGSSSSSQPFKAAPGERFAVPSGFLRSVTTLWQFVT